MSQQTENNPENAEQAYKLCLLGCTHEELAAFFNVTIDTFNDWVSRYKELAEAVKNGMQLADACVAERLYQKALGFSHETLTAGSKADSAEKTTQKYYPPDTSAAIFWLKNRQSEKWGKREEEPTEQTIDVKIED